MCKNHTIVRRIFYHAFKSGVSPLVTKRNDSEKRWETYRLKIWGNPSFIDEIKELREELADREKIGARSKTTLKSRGRSLATAASKRVVALAAELVEVSDRQTGLILSFCTV